MLKTKPIKKQSGSGLIFAVVLLFVILGMVITLSSITVLETKMSQKTKSSIGAFYNSESGVEWALNQIATKNGSAQISTLGSCPFTGCSVLFLDKDGKVLVTSATIDQVKAVRSVGTQGGETQRAIEAAVSNFHLELSQEKDITPTNVSAVRPDAVLAGDGKTFYVNYLQVSPKHRFGLIELDEDLHALNGDGDDICPNVIVGGSDICPPVSNTQVTDARMAAGSSLDHVWYPFESVPTSGDNHHYLNLAAYTVSGFSLELDSYHPQIAVSLPFDPMTNAAYDLLDDPLPFYNAKDGDYYVANTVQHNCNLHIRRFNSSFDQLGDFYLDASSEVCNGSGADTLSVNSLVNTDNGILLITGVFKNSNEPGVTGDLTALYLSDDLKTIRSKAILSDSSVYEVYVSGARYADGKLFIVHDILGGHGMHTGKLKVFDTQNNFKLLENITINSGIMPDNHMTLEYLSNKVYVFYNDADSKLLVKVFNCRR